MLATPAEQRGTKILYAVAAAIGFLIAVYLVMSSWLGLVGIIAAAITVYLWRRLRHGPTPDFVVEGPLLSEAVSPELAAQMASLEQRVRDGESVAEIAPDELDQRSAGKAERPEIWPL